MADFSTPEEMIRFMELMTEQYEKGYITAKEYNEAKKDAAAGIRGYTANLKNSMAQLGTSFKSLGKDIYDGKKGVDQFSGSIDSGANAVAAYALKFGPAGVALGAFTKAVTAFVTASLKQSDLLFDSYQNLSRVGAVGAGAMSEVFDNMLKFGYTVNELNDLGTLLAENSKNFGVFFKSALDGSRAFSDVANQIQNSPLREQFFRLGLSVNEINQNIAGYINQQGRLGRTQGKTVEELARGAEDYLKQLDALTKLTGMSRKEQEDARQQALQIRQFYAGLADLDPNQAEQALQAFTIAYAKGGPEAAADMAANFNGVITNAGKMFMATGGKSMEIFSAEFFKRGGTAAQAYEMLSKSISPEFLEMTKNMNKLNSDMGSFDLQILTLLKGGPEAEKMQKIMEMVRKEQEKQLAGTNSATSAQAKTRENQIKSAQNLQNFVNFGVSPATQALEIFTDVVETLTSFLPGASKAREERAKKEAAKEIPPERKMGLQEKIIQVESGGRNIANQSGPGGAPSSSAFGVAQMTKGTFEGLAKKAGPNNPLKGKNFEDMKADVGLQKEALSQLLDQNRAYLAKLGLSTTDSALYLAHFLGPGGAAKVLSLGDTAPLEGAVAPDQIAANPTLKDMRTIGDIKKWADDKMGGGGYKFGGVASGPTSGYTATLHGTEAIVPLPNGKTIPVEMAGFGSNLADQTNLMSQQLGRLDELIRIMQNQVSVSNKILQAAN